MVVMSSVSSGPSWALYKNGMVLWCLCYLQSMWPSRWVSTCNRISTYACKYEDAPASKKHHKWSLTVCSWETAGPSGAIKALLFRLDFFQKHGFSSGQKHGVSVRFLESSSSSILILTSVFCKVICKFFRGLMGESESEEDKPRFRFIMHSQLDRHD